MLYSLRGKLIHSDVLTGTIVVECGGVGYLCRTTATTIGRLPKAGGEVFVYTYMAVREDAVELYAFHDTDELRCFKLLISVSGVGPKAAVSILSEHSPERLALFVAAGDAKSITTAPGVGGKTAQRIVLELKEKLAGEFAGVEIGATAAAAAGGQNIADAVAALVSIGYAQADAARAVGALDPTLSADSLIKQALKALM
ncbi:MAG: Holliday junction branch migration protein RuvA [Candidatus Howiella sp.]|jgi:Holliday junction DNA helicase RuvA